MLAQLKVLASSVFPSGLLEKNTIYRSNFYLFLFFLMCSSARVRDASLYEYCSFIHTRPKLPYGLAKSRNENVNIMAKNNGHQNFIQSLGIPTPPAPAPYLGNIPKKKQLLFLVSSLTFHSVDFSSHSIKIILAMIACILDLNFDVKIKKMSC